MHSSTIPPAAGAKIPQPEPPHLTVARFEPTVTVDPDEIAFESEPFEVGRLVLFRSHLRRPAPVYEPMVLEPLGGR